jgi:bifunctional non-homologous end joining protein LigD
VSAPVTWEEVEDCRSPEALTLSAPDVAPRLQDYGDLLAPLLEADRAGDLP